MGQKKTLQRMLIKQVLTAILIICSLFSIFVMIVFMINENQKSYLFGERSIIQSQYIIDRIEKHPEERTLPKNDLKTMFNHTFYDLFKKHADELKIVYVNHEGLVVHHTDESEVGSSWAEYQWFKKIASYAKPFEEATQTGFDFLEIKYQGKTFLAIPVLYKDYYIYY